MAVTLLAETTATPLEVDVASSDDGVAAVTGTVRVPAGARAAVLPIETGREGTATLRLRVGEVARDLVVIVGEPPAGALPVVVAPPAGVSVRGVPSAGVVVIAIGSEADVSVALLPETSAVRRVVGVSSSAPTVADVVEPAVVEPGSRSVALRIQSGEPGSAMLRLRLDDLVRDFEVIVGPPPTGRVPVVIARDVGVAVRGVPSGGRIILAEAVDADLTLALLPVPAAGLIDVQAESSDPSIVDVVGTSVVAPGERTAMLRVRGGVAGRARLRLRAGDVVTDLDVIVGEPAEGDIPTVLAPVVGIEVE